MRKLVLALALGMALHTPTGVAAEQSCPHSMETSLRAKQEVYNKADKAHVYDTPERIAMVAGAFKKVTGTEFTDDKETVLGFIQVSMDVWVAVGFRGDCLLGTFRIHNNVYRKMLRAMEFERIKYEG